MQRLLALTFFTAACAGPSLTSAPSFEDAGLTVKDAGSVTAVCVQGDDSTCADTAGTGSVAGSCTATGCRCNSGYEVNRSTGRCRLTVCTLGNDATCDDTGTADSGVAGTCTTSGCMCHSGYQRNPNTGRCHEQRVATCTLGQDLTCNANSSMTTPAGRCISAVAGNTCECNTGYTINPNTGLCE